MNRLTLFQLSSGLMLAAVAAGTQAAEVSSSTDTVKGRAPVAAPVVSPASPMPGDTLTVDVFFSDEDGDAESSSAIQWRRNGAVLSGATGATLLLNQAGIGGDLLSVTVIPQTDPAITDPAIGSPASSAQVRVGSSLITNFLTPDTTPRIWSDANIHCQSLGARLPTRVELQQLFADASSSPAAHPSPGWVTRYEICTVYGWPLNARCGGTAAEYWTNETNILDPDTHVVVTMSRGSSYDKPDIYDANTACVP